MHFYHQAAIRSIIVKEKFFTYFHSGSINIKNVLRKNSFPKDIPSYILLLQNELATRIFCQHPDIKSGLNDHLSYRDVFTQINILNSMQQFNTFAHWFLKSLPPGY